MKTEYLAGGVGALILLAIILAGAPGTPRDSTIYDVTTSHSVFNTIPHIYTGTYVDEGYGLDRTIPVIIPYKTTDKEAYPLMVKIVDKMREEHIEKVRVYFNDKVHMDWKVTDLLTPNCFRHTSYNREIRGMH